jgi:hypothetical protein
MNNTVITDAFIFMKVGDHAGESFNKILTRKRREYEKTGMTFWGYGGNACHPINQVRPFALSTVKKAGSIYLLMQSIHSNADPDILPAKEYSPDGINWEKIPKGIIVTGSKYALVLDEISPADLEIDMNQFKVGIGPSRDKKASDYLTGRTDKACLTHDLSSINEESPNIKKIDFIAKLKDPYAVVLSY